MSGVTRYRVRVRQVLEYVVEADDSPSAWEQIEGPDFGDPSDAIYADTPDVLWVRPESTGANQ